LLLQLSDLSATRRPAPPRQQTLEATLEWSHGLLASSEQVVLRRLSVFAGSFSLTIGCQVAALDMEPRGLIDAIAALVDKSLLQVDRADPPRYRLLETMKQFAGRRLLASGESQTIARRHLRAMAEVARELEASYWLLPEAQWLTEFGPHYAD